MKQGAGDRSAWDRLTILCNEAGRGDSSLRSRFPASLAPGVWSTKQQTFAA